MADKSKVLESLKAENVRIGVKAETWEEAITATGMTLVENGYVKEGYIQDAINRELKYPTGLEVEPIGVAIPHGEVQGNIIDSAIGVSVLEKPVKFTNMATGNTMIDVQILMMLAFKDAASQLDVLQGLMSVLPNKEVIEKLLQAKDGEEYVNIFCSAN